jgi:hypothetical protein
MNLAILFWFYKEPDICENRLEQIRKYNPGVRIFGLYGGSHEEASLYEQQLGKYLDDFYLSPSEDSNWKWIHGDLMILDWYEKRGRILPWENIAVVQWDMLVFDSLTNQFKDMKDGEIFLSGMRDLTPEIEERWRWTKRDGVERSNYLAYKDYIKREYGYVGLLKCCLFILEIFPRDFFEKYLMVGNMTVGMLEYKIPTYAKIFDTPVFQKDFGVWWFDTETERSRTPLNAKKMEIEKTYIDEELKKSNGARIFHPYLKKW